MHEIAVGQDTSVVAVDGRERRAVARGSGRASKSVLDVVADLEDLENLAGLRFEQHVAVLDHVLERCGVGLNRGAQHRQAAGALGSHVCGLRLAVERRSQSCRPAPASAFLSASIVDAAATYAAFGLGSAKIGAAPTPPRGGCPQRAAECPPAWAAEEVRPALPGRRQLARQRHGDNGNRLAISARDAGERLERRLARPSSTGSAGRAPSRAASRE